MEIINGSKRLPPLNAPLFLALGNFDGVHRGHQAIIRTAVREARDKKGYSAAMLFDPHPIIALRPEKPLTLLTDVADRAAIMKELGLDYLLVEPFTEELSTLSPEQFVRLVLKERLNVKGVYIGADYSFGRGGAGGAEALRYWGRKLKFRVVVSPMLEISGRRVSSSIIRSLLLAGAVNEAADLLNYYFFRQGRVVRGYGIGSKMVYPTANITANPHLLWPGKGVYLTAVGNLDGGLLFGVTNVGARPTFARYDLAVETHILNFEGMIYNREIRLCFLEKLRETKTFATPDQLKSQIALDIQRAGELIGAYRLEKTGNGHSLQAGCSVLRSL